MTVTYEAPESNSEEIFDDTISIVTNAQEKPLQLPTRVRILGEKTSDNQNALSPLFEIESEINSNNIGALSQTQL